MGKDLNAITGFEIQRSETFPPLKDMPREWTVLSREYYDIEYRYDGKFLEMREFEGEGETYYKLTIDPNGGISAFERKLFHAGFEKPINQIGCGGLFG